MEERGRSGTRSVEREQRKGVCREGEKCRSEIGPADREREMWISDRICGQGDERERVRELKD